METGDGRSEYWGALAVARAHAGDTQGAAEAIQRSLAINPGDTRALQAQELLQT